VRHGALDAGPEEGVEEIPRLREEFWHDLRVVGGMDRASPSLEKANRLSDFLEVAELMCRDALHRTESCGGHFASRARRPTAKQNGTTPTSPTWRPGMDRARRAARASQGSLAFEHVPLSQRELQVAMNLRFRSGGSKHKGPGGFARTR